MDEADSHRPPPSVARQRAKRDVLRHAGLQHHTLWFLLPDPTLPSPGAAAVAMNRQWTALWHQTRGDAAGFVLQLLECQTVARGDGVAVKRTASHALRTHRTSAAKALTGRSCIIKMCGSGSR